MRHQGILKQFERGANPLCANRVSAFSRNQRILLSFLLLWLLSAAICARADDQIRAVRLSNVVGGVQILSGAETEFAQAYPNMPLMQGSTLKTGEDGRAEIQLEDGSVLRLTPNSSAALSVLSRTSDGNTNSEIDLLTGLAYVESKGAANQRFVVHFGGNEVISPAPASFRVNLDANPVEFAVLDGSAHLSNGTAYAVDVRANETVRFDPNDGGRYFLAQGVDPDSWDQWNADRDQAMSQMAAQETREAQGSGAGWSDLDYYGNWYSASDGTSFWMPDGAGAGWDPYGSGYWGYYGGAGGYVWISGYPWGWLPYHCGMWNYYDGFNGWGWVPSNCSNRWYPSGGIGYAPPRYRRLPHPNPVGPVVGGYPRLPLRNRLIAVDRGPEATTLTPRVGAAPRVIGVGGQTARLLPKTVNPVVAEGRPGAPSSERVRTGYVGAPPIGNVPAYRPVAPSGAYRAPAPSYPGRASAGSSQGSSSAGRSSYSATAPPAASHASSGGSSGGGHVH